MGVGLGLWFEGGFMLILVVWCVFTKAVAG